ncbi:hypothetical protein [Candidatus Nitrososphaera sp. FF02]|uniref:hypothetical protein n=1 Tax=Candidatus Nitrososphaera sp. FF02 TaxID=3398226 RepID=UPI0039EBA502
MLAAARRARVERVTKETSVTVQVNIDGSGATKVKTGLPFIDHLITSIGKHSMIDITLAGKSNDGIMHHLAEDVAIALAQTIDKALGDRARVTRFGERHGPDGRVAGVRGNRPCKEAVQQDGHQAGTYEHRGHTKGRP